MRCLALLAVALLTLAGCAEKALRPNVVLIVLDTTRADRCSSGGYERDTTPTLARFAEEGARFRDAWAPSSWTAPSHASLFTGLRPEHHGLMRENREFLRPESTTIAEIMRQAGYRTACFLNNCCLEPCFGTVQGFERFVPMYEDAERDYPWAPETHRRALDWALGRSRKGESFFLFINNLEPHFPYTPPEPARRALVSSSTPEDVLNWGRLLEFPQILEHIFGVEKIEQELLDHMSELYDAEIRALDEALGILIEGLRAEGILDETVFVITSDHGENLGDHGLLGHVGSLHRSLRQIPLLIRFPSAFAAGTVVQEVVRLEDVPPTILELCGLEVPEGLDGASLLRDLPGRVSRAVLGPPFRSLGRLAERADVESDPKAFRTSMRAVYDGRHHLIRHSDGREELYDVSSDPGETRNLAGSEGETLERMRELLPGD